MSEKNLITVELIDAKPDAVTRQLLQLPAGSRLADLLQAANIDSRSSACFGVFGEVKTLDYVLAEGDRVEAYRPLLQDPKLKRIAKVDRSHLPRRCR